MAASAQARFDKLFANNSKPEKPKQGDLHFSEKELLEYQQRQQKNAPFSSGQITHDGKRCAEENESIQIQASAKSNEETLSYSEPRVSEVGNRSHGHVPGTRVSQMVFLPKDVRHSDLTATQIEEDGLHCDIEPVSSSHERVGHFCVWPLVVKLPYKYMQDPDGKVSQRFFASQKIFQRNWKVYYIHGPHSAAFKPLLLVPFEQVETLIQEISNEFQFSALVPPYPFQLSFYKDGTPQPQYLGTINSKQDMQEIQSKIPLVPEDYGQAPDVAIDTQRQDHEASCEKIRKAFEATNKKTGAKRKQHQQQKRNTTVMENVNQLKRAQRYLGLRQKVPMAQINRAGQGAGDQAQQIKALGFYTEALDVSKPAPFPFEDETVIIAIDVESWERDHNLITEIGVSTLDTADLRGVAPGEQGDEWVKKIRSRHFRINGREGLRNTQYLHGSPEMFQFGHSEFVAIDEAAEMVDSCFEFPYSAGFECAGPPDTDAGGLPVLRKPGVLDKSQRPTGVTEPRSLLLLGHDIGGDIDYLSALGSTIFRYASATSADAAARRHKVLSSIRERLDTATLYKSLKKDDQTRSLVKLCYELGITAWYAHNAGNDARYTLECFVKMIIKDRQQEDVANAVARDTGTFDVEHTLRETEKEQFVDVKIAAARRDILAGLAAGDELVVSATSQRIPPPYFATAQSGASGPTGRGTSEEMTYEDPTWRKWQTFEAPLSADAEQLLGKPWTTPAAPSRAAAVQDAGDSEDEYPY